MITKDLLDFLDTYGERLWKHWWGKLVVILLIGIILIATMAVFAQLITSFETMT